VPPNGRPQCRSLVVTERYYLDLTLRNHLFFATVVLRVNDTDLPTRHRAGQSLLVIALAGGTLLALV
jgi:hypothetical protein